MEVRTRLATLHNVDASLPERASVTLEFDDGAFRMLPLDPPGQAQHLYRHVGQLVLAVYRDAGLDSRALWVGAVVEVSGMRDLTALPPALVWEGAVRVDADQGRGTPLTGSRIGTLSIEAGPARLSPGFVPLPGGNPRPVEEG